tara:strand:+ start:583 stop:768 length:186 start_codon:yes stop_codon:yes gene_type:complete
MSLNRPSSNKKPDEQSSKTPSGKEIPTAMSMMVDSMVRMIQKANIDIDEIHNNSKENINEN